jgi:ABC-type lipoprotein export system ATPase subunit
MEATMMDNEILAQTIDLAKVYEDKVCALDGVNLTVHRGEFLSVMGPSGSGKSTLLNLLGALDRPTRGEIYIAGESLRSKQDLDRFRSHTVGFVFQLHNLLPTLTAHENVEIPMFEIRISNRERRNRAMRLLEEVGLADKADQLPPRLSGGERQRVAIARAIANEPQILLADEPTGNLDSTSGAEIMHALRKLNREKGTTVLIVTHDPSVARSTDRIVVLQDGRIIRDEPTGDPYWRDLREFKLSRLGQVLMEGKVPAEIQELGLERLLPELRDVLASL